MPRKARRRAVLGGAGALLLAGCTDTTGDNQVGDGDGAGFSDSDPTPVTKTIIEDRDTVEEDYYLSYSFRLNYSANIDVRATVRSGPRLDMVMASRDEFDEFERGNRFRWYEPLTDTDSAGFDGSGRLGSGEYVFIVDNSEQIVAEPPQNFDEDPARVELEITGTYTPR